MFKPSIKFILAPEKGQAIHNPNFASEYNFKKSVTELMGVLTIIYFFSNIKS